MGEKVIPSLFRLLFLWLPVMGSPWEKQWEYLCWTTWMWSNCSETADVVSKRGWIWRQAWTRFLRLPRLRSLTDGNRSTVWEREQLPGESAKCSRDSLPGPSCSLSWSAAIGPCVLPLPYLPQVLPMARLLSSAYLTHWRPWEHVIFAQSLWSVYHVRNKCSLITFGQSPRLRWPWQQVCGSSEGNDLSPAELAWLWVSLKQSWGLSELGEASSVAFVEWLTQARPYVSALCREADWLKWLFLLPCTPLCCEPALGRPTTIRS